MRVSTNGRVTRNKSEWSEIIANFEKSGLSIREFYNQEKILASSLRRWQNKLKPKPKSRQFIPVKASSPMPKAWALSITLPNGCQLRFEG